MVDREKKYIDGLARCRANIAKSKTRIEYHRDMIKKLERKETELSENLDKLKMTNLLDEINKGGYDIDRLREAVTMGDFSSMFVKKTELEIMAKTEETPVQVEQEQENISIERKDK